MPSCASCGGTEELCLYERHDPRYKPRRWWWCIDCSYFAIRLNGIAADPVAPSGERARRPQLSTRPMDERRDRRLSAGRRRTDRGYGVDA
jgi:hypothetical protein